MIHRVAYKYWVAIILVMALFMEFLDGTIVNVAMPTFARVFEAGATAIGWVSTAYLLAIAVVVLVSGWAGERFGTKRVFLVATGVFTLGSALCASATSLRALVAFRALQGMGGGMMTPVGVSMLMRAFPVEERARASGALMVPTMLAPVMAPFLGGYLVQYHGWPWIFWINVPLGAVTWVAAAWLLRESREASPGRLDLEGLAVSTVALGCIFYTLSRLGEGADRPAGVAGAAVVGVVALVTFLVRQWRKTHPLMDLRVFGDRLFATGAGLQFLLIGGLSGSLFALTLCLQEGQ
ncbi:MAG TPA: DHA2 family efflux MFS transporter permease subunit, partial [Myxococcota bacterium]|nr:DHA2 family efflux MFS transporter permease subunit [Myxococcota bacterium]